MIYIFDTSSFIVLSHYFPDRFPTFWQRFETEIGNGKVLSVREVFNELASPRPWFATWNVPGLDLHDSWELEKFQLRSGFARVDIRADTTHKFRSWLAIQLSNLLREVIILTKPLM